MDYLAALLDLLPQSVWPYIQLLSVEQWRMVGQAFCAIWIAAACWFSYYCIRRGLGHRKWHGQWYNPEQLQMLVQELYAGVKDGRVPDHETMVLLDEYIYGRQSDLRRLNRSDAI